MRLLRSPPMPLAAWLILSARALRAFNDGFVAILLPAWLLALGLDRYDVGVLSTATLFGSALLTLAVGQWGHRSNGRALLLGAAWLMATTGFLFAGLERFWPLLLVAFVGTLNPSSGDVSVFLPLEHARLAQSAEHEPELRNALFTRYSFIGALGASLGALAAGLPQLFMHLGLPDLSAFRLMFVGYGLSGVVIVLLYRRLPVRDHAADQPHESPPPPAQPLGPSRGIVMRLAMLFSLDAFAGGLLVNALLALWLFERFGLSLAAAGTFFFWTGLFSSASQLVAPYLARRIGLVNTMVFTHIPASLCLIGAALAPGLSTALALLLLRSLLSQMDVPARSAFVMSVVTPAERPAAASFTAVPRSLAAAASPALGGALLAAGWLAAPLLLCGALKITYDLALWRAFRRVRSEP